MHCRNAVHKQGVLTSLWSARPVLHLSTRKTKMNCYQKIPPWATG